MERGPRRTEVSGRKPESKRPEEPTRRDVLIGLGALGVTAAAGGVYWWSREPSKEPNEPDIPEPPLRRPEQVPDMEEYERFAGEVSAYEAAARLRFDEVLFVDENDQPIGEPVSVSDVPGDPGERDSTGMLVGGFRGEWLDAAREYLQKQYPEHEFTLDTKRDLPRVLQYADYFNDASRAYFSHIHPPRRRPHDPSVGETVEEPDPLSPRARHEVALARAITDGAVDQYIELVAFNARYCDPKTESSYYAQLKEFQIENVPEPLAEEIERIVPGLVAKESTFQNDVTSSANARGLLQLKRDAWIDVAVKEAQDRGEFDGRDQDSWNTHWETIKTTATEEFRREDFYPLSRQLEVAGQYFALLYEQLQHYVGEGLWSQLRDLHADEETFQRRLVAPLLINAYNTGARRMGEAVTAYAATHELGASTGSDLFIAIVEHAKASTVGALAHFGSDAREYVPRIYALTNALDRSMSNGPRP